MQTITNWMTQNHRTCDETFSFLEKMLNQQDWKQSAVQLQRFKSELFAHFDAEEQLLFPAFEQATGMTHGPTSVMRVEHEQMRGLFDALEQALVVQDFFELEGELETFHILLQQHNMKEESILYPMSDARLAEPVAMQKQLVEYIEQSVKAVA